MKLFKLNSGQVALHMGNTEDVTHYLEMNGLSYKPFTVINEKILVVDENKIHEIDSIKDDISEELFEELEKLLEI